jgi:hypothetical protein
MIIMFNSTFEPIQAHQLIALMLIDCNFENIDKSYSQLGPSGPLLAGRPVDHIQAPNSIIVKLNSPERNVT